MSAQQDDKVLKLFDAVVDLPPAEQDAYLQKHCQDARLRRRVDAMLLADQAATGLLEQPAEAHLEKLAGDCSPTKSAAAAAPTIDQYRVVKLIGEGGMAMVYQAERVDAGFEQTVALKLIHPGMASSQWQERFLRERQIMASLQHPHIAQLLDGGVTSTGQPYLALEYVDGDSITRYADEQQLTIEQRLDLLLDVCDAVSYAHRNLIVHRDLKPSNILVAQDGVVKLLDFGIAKLLGDSDASLTATGQRALTPEYAAPEQFTGDAVTTATDVYALGVILYELIAGRRPFVSTGASALELERQVLTDGPPSLSRLTAGFAAEQQQTIANARGVSWSRLKRSLKGDLQNIALKALSKEPERRYGTVAQLSEDLRAYLRGRPVQAHAGRIYRLAKFLQRHRLLVGAAVLVLFASGAGVFSTLRQAKQAQQESARAQAVQSFLIEEMLSAAKPEVAQGRAVTVVEVLQQAAANIDGAFPDQPELRAALQHATGEALLSVGELSLASDQLQNAANGLTTELGNNHPDALLAERDLGRLHLARSDLDAAEQVLSRVLDKQRNASGPKALPALVTESWLAETWRQQGQWAKAEQQSRATLNALEQHYPDAWRERLRVTSILSSALSDQRNDSQAEAFARRALRLQQERLGADHPDVANTLLTIASLLRKQQRLGDAELVMVDAIDLRRRVLGDEHLDTLRAEGQLATVYWFREDYAEMVEVLEAVLQRQRRLLGDRHDDTVRTLSNLALGLNRSGNQQRAIALMEEAANYYSQTKGAGSPDAMRQWKNLHGVLLDLGQADRLLANGKKLLEIAHQTVAAGDLGATRLNDFAYLLLTIEPASLRDPTTALVWAERSIAMAEQPAADIFDTLAMAYRANGDIEKAIATQLEATKAPQGLYIYNVERELVSMYAELADRAAADEFLREHLAARIERLGSEHKLVGWSHLWIGRNLIEMGRPVAAEQSIRAALDQFARSVPEDDPFVYRAWSHLADALLSQGRFEEAEPLAVQGYEGLLRYPRERVAVKRAALSLIVELYEQWGKPEQAQPWHEQLMAKVDIPERGTW